MRKTFVVALVAALAVSGSAVFAGSAKGPAPKQQQQTGTLNGVAQGADKAPLPNYTVRIRSVQTGQLVGTTTSNQAGQFTFAGLQPGNYVVEVVDASGKIVGLSPAISVAGGASVSVTVGATAAGALTSASGGGFSLLGLGPLASVAVVGAAGVAAVAAVVATKNDASPSK